MVFINNFINLHTGFILANGYAEGWKGIFHPDRTYFSPYRIPRQA